MKRKRRRPIPSISLVDTLLSLDPTFECIDSPHEEIVGVRDFSGVPYHLYTTKNSLRLDFEMIRHMVSSRGSFTGRRSFLGQDGRLLAVDVHQREQPHKIYSLENFTEECRRSF